MKILLLGTFLVMQQFVLNAGSVNKVCLMGFEKLVLLSNQEVITDTEFQEAELITDTLYRNKCRDYEVDKNGVIYASASLTYLFGKICKIKKSLHAYQAYLAYLSKQPGSAEEDLDTSLEELFHVAPNIFIQAIDNNKYDMNFFHRLAWGFLNNIYMRYGNVNIDNYKPVFYQRYPMFKDVNNSEVLRMFLQSIEEELR